MKLSGFLTSAGINILICIVLSILYSILRKQPGHAGVYFGQRISQAQQAQSHDPLCFDRFVPSTSWIRKAWETSEEEIFAIGGLDAVVFLRIVVFSIRIFSIAAIICFLFVLPLNYFGQEMKHTVIPKENLDVFTIGNVKERSAWLWVHCLALYIISFCACVLLYLDYKGIAKMRLAHFTRSPSNLSHFTVLVRAIPWSSGESYSDVVTKFFSHYYASSYLSHQMVYRSDTVQKLVTDAKKMYKIIKSTPITQHCGTGFIRCGLCGGTANSFKKLSNEPENCERSVDFGDPDLREKECAAALVFFRTRYAALVASQSLQSPNPMIWVTDLAPEPHDMYWSNLYIPFRLLWIRKTGTFLASILFSFFFLAPATFVQGLVHLDKLQNAFPFMRAIVKRSFLFELVTGYLPSVMLMIFLYTAPPIMMLLSALEGNFSRSVRKRSACLKVLYFLIWNVFFANILTGTVIDRLGTISTPIDIPIQLAKAVPQQAFFFMTYVLTSGWAGLASELLQPFVLICNWLDRLLFRSKGVISYDTMTFPYHTEIPRLLLFGMLGFTFSVMAPLILPFLLVYFFLAYLVYRNQVLIEMDWQDQQSGKMEDIHEKLLSAYSQFTPTNLGKPDKPHHGDDTNDERFHDPENRKPGIIIFRVLAGRSYCPGGKKISGERPCLSNSFILFSPSFSSVLCEGETDGERGKPCRVIA
ncbi:hypothetical protein LguiB_019860 [Lonicera macranthoides]